MPSFPSENEHENKNWDWKKIICWGDGVWVMAAKITAMPSDVKFCFCVCPISGSVRLNSG